MKDMFLGATPMVFERAKELRNNMTIAEAILWQYLRTNPMGYKFRRQHPLDIFIVDFYCHQLKLAIEVDGGVHKTKDIMKDDTMRQNYLEGEGVSFIRFTNDDVAHELDKVKAKITASLYPQPPKGGFE